MVLGFVASLILRAVGKDWGQEQECAVSEVQLGELQMEASNDAESTGLRSEETALSAQGLHEPRLATCCNK